ncbi:holo-ACP synthase [Gemmatimonadota bacterium]
MVLGVGVDLLEVARMERELAREDGGFRGTVFTVAEVAQCTASARPAEAFAGRFAAKEALIKALGGVLTEDFRWLDMEVLASAGGETEVALHGGLRRLADGLGVRQIRLAISTAGGTAAAFAVLESRYDPDDEGK